MKPEIADALLDLDEEIDPVEELLRQPLWRAEDLGKPIPRSPHAASVAMPLWEHVVRYEEGDPELIESLEGGYPRFVFGPAVNRLFQKCRAQFSADDELCIAFPSKKSAARCAAFLRDTGPYATRVVPYGLNDIHVVVLPSDAFESGKKYWQHYGEIVSSRLAQATLEERSAAYGLTPEKRALRKRIAQFVGDESSNVYLYPSGMAALSGVLRLLRSRTPAAKTIQLGFPYVDLLKIQQKWGPLGEFYPHVSDESFDELVWQVTNEPIAGVFVEHPCNPLLQSMDIERLSKLLRPRRVPLVVDETLASFVNVDLTPYADIIVTSLTKYFSGVGDVMAGSAVLNGSSPLIDELKRHQRKVYEDRLWAEDAAALERNSRDFEVRMRRINANAETVCEYLRTHPQVQRVYYPKFETPDQYSQVWREGAGYGGLFSLLLKNAPDHSAKFYAALRVSKGPSLGTSYTLACPYVLLAHYKELDWAESLGVSPYLIRVSVGLEDPADLIHRFDQAFKAL
jgi:cystathionine gamma-synthase